MIGRRALLAFFLSWGVAAAGAGAARAAEFAEYEAVEDVVYGHKEGLALTLDVLKPRQNAKGIGLILVSSGSWRSGKSNVMADEERRRQGEHWVQGLLQGGYTLFVARHGSMPRYRLDEIVDDIRRSVRYVRAHAGEYGVDPERLGITSGSSGGHLSLMVGLTGDDGDPESKDEIARHSSRVQAIVAWFPPTDLVNWGSPNGYAAIKLVRPKLFEEMFGEISNLEAQLKTVSPIYYASEDDPPLLLIHGDSDRTVPLQQSEVMRDKYAELGLPVELIVEPGGGHSYWPGIMEDYPAVWTFFDAHLAKDKTE